MYKWVELYILYMATQATKYGRYTVERERDTSGYGTTDVWYVRNSGANWEAEVGQKQSGKKLARTLAAVLDAADVHRPSEVMPPEWGARGITANGEWEEWAADAEVIPAQVACGGRAAIAGWLKVIHKEKENWIANEIGVSEQTVRQYLSDLREGRR
jgi:hypothetical protein